MDIRRFEDDLALGRDREVDGDGASVHHLAMQLQPPPSSGGIDSRDEDGKTLLHRAAEKGMQNYVRLICIE